MEKLAESLGITRLSGPDAASLHAQYDRLIDVLARSRITLAPGAGLAAKPSRVRSSFSRAAARPSYWGITTSLA